MSIELLELAAEALDPLLGHVVFLGGATVVLWVTDPAAPPVRPTIDVDVVAEVTTRLAFHTFEGRLRALRFEEDREEGVICRWRHRDSDLILDAMPLDPAILGFENRWQGPAATHAIEQALPSTTTIRVASPTYLLATKIEAFHSRGKEDFLASRDLEDIITLIDGREEIVAETLAADTQLRAYLAKEIHRLLADRRLRDGISASLPGDPASQARAQAIVIPRMQRMSDIDATNSS